MAVEADQLLKSVADEMARQLSGSGGADAVLLLERFGLLSSAGRAAPGARAGHAAASSGKGRETGTRTGRVGVWEGGPEGWQRAPALRHEWPFWAQVESIPPKGERRRVVLVGESAARGFLYDPELNPAQALGACAARACGQPVEVVDLAKSDIQAPELLSLLAAAEALEPDVLVLFAGNNWHMHDPRDRHLEAAVLRRQGAAGLKALREQRLAAFAGETLRRQLAELAARVPVVVVVPEINLADWRLDAAADAPWLPHGANRRWLERRAAARAALAAGRRGEAADLAREMIELDGGTAASGWTLLADGARQEGDVEAARGHLEKARDAHLWDYTHQTPRTLSLVQEALRGCALPGRIATVDLPRRFAAWQPGELPGRRLFLDYCHLTAEGIRVAMADAALAVAALLDADRPLPAFDSVVAAAPAPPVRVEAAAHFAAALHSAHWGQQGAVVAFYCREAARLSPEIARAMRAYLELQVRRAPAWACTAAEQLAEAATPVLRGYVLQHQGKLFDPVLLPAIAGALEESGLPSVDFLDALRREERSLDGRPRDLLDPYHRASWADLDWLEWPTHFRRAYAPKARYPWVSRTPRATDFALTCRRGGGAGAAAGECRVWINGSAVADLQLTGEWASLRFSAPAALVQAGVNWLEIDWPQDLAGGEAAIDHIAREHELGRFVPLLPVFAEISALTAVQT